MMMDHAMRKRSAVHAMREVTDRRTARGKTKGKIGFHGGKVEVERPRLRGFDGKDKLCRGGRRRSRMTGSASGPSTRAMRAPSSLTAKYQAKV